MRAKLRRLAIVRRLRHVGDIHQRGLQRQLAEELGVVASVICEDFKKILAVPRLGGHVNERQGSTRGGGRLHQPKEEAMSQRCTVRLPDMLYEFLHIEARQRSTSDGIREALERLLGLASAHRAETSEAPEQVAMSAPAPHDCTETVLARLPLDVREDILARARLLDLPVSQVVTSLLIVQQPSSQPVPQVSGATRPQTAFARWLEIHRQRPHGSEVVLPDAAPSSTTPIPGTASLNGGGQDGNARPHGSWSPPVVERTRPTQRR
jgi:Arc/MetJ-type ribon-helix-helix transcriptional regulator